MHNLWFFLVWVQVSLAWTVSVVVYKTLVVSSRPPVQWGRAQHPDASGLWVSCHCLLVQGVVWLEADLQYGLCILPAVSSVVSHCWLFISPTLFTNKAGLCNRDFYFVLLPFYNTHCSSFGFSDGRQSSFKVFERGVFQTDWCFWAAAAPVIRCMPRLRQRTPFTLHTGGHLLTAQRGCAAQNCALGSSIVAVGQFPKPWAFSETAPVEC